MAKVSHTQSPAWPRAMLKDLGNLIQPLAATFGSALQSGRPDQDRAIADALGSLILPMPCSLIWNWPAEGKA
jgi:hypothetical protein